MSLTVLGDLTRRRGACALIAIKERARCKTRLADVLRPPERIDLVRSMLTAVLAAAGNAQTVHQVIVISPERDTVPAEIPVLADTGESLNTALVQAHTMVREFGCHEIVVLPADLPLITSAEIDELVRAARAGGFAMATDAAGVGTNALCLMSTQPFRFQFGPDSRRLHLQEAQRLGSSPQEVHLAGLEFDVDSSADLRLLDGQKWLTRLRA
ncbi:MAG TPA: 2-phospho-L-lactate guanylyltransferase [Steroidobacteraceae bacterium]|jgi:2-phospho-L-lactate guanylyltransferase|nr:2-phospho-L-lactate guanylyltransferase [Steroidobacteraceae bacterium]